MSAVTTTPPPSVSSEPTAAETSGADTPSNDGTVTLDAGPLSATDQHASIDGSVPNSCTTPIYLACGDRLSHDTRVQGRAQDWFAYGCSARGYTGRETIYEFTSNSNCGVEARLTAVDVALTLFFMKECDPIKADVCRTIASPGETATANFVATAEHAYFVAVDGADGAEGPYTLEVDCNCDTDQTVDASVTSP